MSIYPAPADALFFEGNHCMAAGDMVKAEECFRQALALAPAMSEALVNLGFLQEHHGAFDEAEASYRQGLAIAPDCVQVYLNLGVLLMKRKCFSASEAVYRQALTVAPGSAAVWSNLGVLLACEKREDEAERCYRSALEIDENYDKAKFNLAYLLLRQGRFEEGWQCLEARDSYDILTDYFSCPRWHGQSLSGQSVIIGFEAGQGDMIQFCRYAFDLKRLGAIQVAIICHPGLKVLFASLAAVDQVFSFDDTIPSSDWDFWTLPLSLPHYFKTRLENIPASIPYLSADPVRLAKWSRLLPSRALRVGLAWKGNPLFENDADRSLPSLALLAPVMAVADVQFVSLQVGDVDRGLPGAGFPLLVLEMEMRDFADTAAIIEQLDLVISVDTAVAHLAGALGKQCWLLLPDYRPDWRWMAERTDTPWYPGMRLFRQAAGGDWLAVMETVAVALKAWVREQGAT